AVENAYRTLLSDGLAAVAIDSSEVAPAPTVSGTYTCDEPGTYTLTVYTSDTKSGYSYHLSGLETGNFPVSTTQPAPLGSCGLRIQFAAGENYNRSVWHIDLPNTAGAVYTKNQNAYQAARTTASTSIRLAEQELALALANAADTVAPARREAIAGASAAVEQAAAQLTRIDTQLADRTLRAPFTGVITDVTAEPGETVSTAPIITLLTGEQFEVTARIPEIDIGKLAVGQSVRMIFDARPSEPLMGTIRFVSPQASIIDGVSYYEAIITPDTTPAWVRSGLNADIDIIINAQADAPRIPRRFLIETATGHAVQQLQGDGSVSTTTVTVSLEGNDGYVAITGLSAGATVVAPE
ncbi:MAG: efflux RND transporter periplasmic adaptor subunit, partial [Patescibacteria group bacterium]